MRPKTEMKYLQIVARYVNVICARYRETEGDMQIVLTEELEELEELDVDTPTEIALKNVSNAHAFILRCLNVFLSENSHSQRF